MSVEALLRWEHPERGLLAPGEFLDIAEERSLVVPIGTWALNEACRQGSAWRATLGPASPSVSVNVSARQLGTHDFSGRVQDALDGSGIPPGLLVLEITERQILTVAHSARAELDRISDLDVRLSMDDFGTGYSTFAYLRSFHFDILKIDRSFVSGLGKDPVDTAIVRALLAVSASLELDVIAEGCETAEQLDELASLGCGFVQGYYLHRPMPAANVEELLQHAGAPA